MARNFDGLGVGFEVEWGPAMTGLNHIYNGVENLWGGVKKLGSAAPAMGKSFMGGIKNLGQKGSQAFGAVSMAMGTMVDKAMSPELDHAYSSMYTGFNKSFAALTAGMNVTQKEMDKARSTIGSAAFGMGEDMDQAATNWVHFEKQGIELDKILGTQGLTNTIKGLIKVTSVYEMQGEQLAQVMSGLIKGFGFTEEQVGSLADKMVASGKVFNMGKEVMQGWPAILESLNTELADFGKTLSPKEIEKMTLSIVQLGGGLKEALGLAPEQAVELARTMFTTIAGERKNIIDMFRGMGGEFGEMAKGLMETGGDVNKMFEMMSSGDPLKFMDTLAAMAKQAKESGGESGIAFQRLNKVMSEALGPDVAFAMKGNWEKASSAMAQVPDALKSSKGLFKGIADEHWKSSITAGESWDRMTQMMKAQLFGLSQGEVNTWKKNMQAGFKDTFKTIEVFAKDEGPLGQLTKRMLAVQRVGLTALLPGLGGMAPLLGGIATSSIPVLTALGSMGLSFGSLGKMALGGGLLWGVFQLLQDGPEKAWEKLESFGDNFKNMFTKLPKETQEKLLKLKDKVYEFFDDFKSGKILRDMKSFFDKVPWDAIFGGIRKGLMSVASGIGTFLGEVDWVSVITNLTSLLGKAITTMGGVLYVLFTGGGKADMGEKKTEDYVGASMTNVLGSVLTTVKNVLLGGMKGLWGSIFQTDSIAESAGNLVKLAAGALAGLLVFSKKFRTMFVGGIKKGMKAGKKSASSGFKGMGATFKSGMKGLGKTMKMGVKALGGIGLFMGLMEGLDQLKQRTQEIGDVMLDEFVPDSQKAAMAGEKAFKGMLSTIDAVLLGLPSMIGQATGMTSDAVTQIYHDMVATVETSINAVVTLFSRSWDWIANAATGTWAEIAHGWDVAKLGILDGMVWLGKQIATKFQSFGRILFYPFEWLGFKLKGWIAGFVDDVIGNAPTWIKDLIGKENIKSMEGWVKGTKKEQESFLKGRDFSAAYGEQTKTMQKALGGLFDEVTGDLAGERKLSDQTVNNVVAGLAKEQARNTKAIGNWLSDSIDYSDRAMAAASKTAQASILRDKRLEEGEVDTVAETEVPVPEEKKKGRRKRRAKRSVSTPTAEERVAVNASAATPAWLAPYLKESEVRIAGAVTKAMEKRPMNVNVQVESKLDGKKVGAGLAKHERNKAAVYGR